LVVLFSLGSHLKSQQRGICRQHGTEWVVTVPSPVRLLYY
jgi:hypothetical protein